MPKPKLKTLSRRMTTKKLSKINKKVREHKRKMKKLERHNPKRVSLQSLVKKESVLPNIMPFKEHVLRDAEQAVASRQMLKQRDTRLTKERKVERETNKEIKRSLSRSEKMDLLLERAMIPGGLNMPEVMFPTLAEKRDKVLKDTNASVAEMTKAHYKDFKEVVKQSDIILQVLDARDPLGSRCKELEDYIIDSGPNKRLVLLLNKIDLIPRENLMEWLRYLRNEYPTVAFKASTQPQRNNLKQQKGKIEKLPAKAMKMRGCLGAEKLLQLFGNYCRNKDIKSKITVGIVGFPNTGKSSVINSLKRSKSCMVGAVPGITRTVQRVYLDRHTWLLDSPGLVLSRDMSSVGAILHNCVNVNQIDDPIPPVAAILKRCNKEQMMMRYLITDYTDERNFLQLVAKRYGYVLQGGVPDVKRAGKQILQEWNVGRIRYFTHVPKQRLNQSHERAEIVKEMSKPFDLESLFRDEYETLNSLKGQSVKDTAMEEWSGQAETTGEAAMDDGDDEGDTADMDTDDRTMTVQFPDSNSKKSLVKTKEKDSDMMLPGNQRANRQVTRDFRKMKKERKRADVVSACLSDALNSALASTTT